MLFEFHTLHPNVKDCEQSVKSGFSASNLSRPSLQTQTEIGCCSHHSPSDRLSGSLAVNWPSQALGTTDCSFIQLLLVPERTPSLHHIQAIRLHLKLLCL